MSIFREIPPTAGFPISAREYFSAFSKKNRSASLEEDLKAYLDVPAARITYSGTAAFYIILEALKTLSNKKTVIIPAFICPLVPLAIKRAGLKIKVCDISKNSFNFDIDQLAQLCSDNDILAIVAAHLGGIPLEFGPIRQIAEKNKIFVIEDCAQSLGAVYKGTKVGKLGDFSFFSLCRGKGLTIYEGGSAASKNLVYNKSIDDTIARIVNDDHISEALKILELFGYWIFYRPQLFWFAYSLPQVYWNARGQRLRALSEYFTIDFPLHRVSGFRKSVGHAAFPRIESEIDKQRQKAFYYMEKLKNTGGMTIINESPGDRATYPFLTIVFDDKEKRDKAQKVFKNSGLGVSQVYYSAITDYGYLDDIIEKKACPNARYLAEREITLSTSAFLTNKNMDLVVNKIKNIL